MICTGLYGVKYIDIFPAHDFRKKKKKKTPHKADYSFKSWPEKK